MSLKHRCKSHPDVFIEDCHWKKIPCWECDPGAFGTMFGKDHLDRIVEDRQQELLRRERKRVVPRAPLDEGFKRALRESTPMPSVLKALVEEYIIPGPMSIPGEWEHSDEFTMLQQSVRPDLANCVAQLAALHFKTGCSAVIEWQTAVDKLLTRCMIKALTELEIPVEDRWPNLISHDEKRGVCVRIVFITFEMPATPSVHAWTVRHRIQTAGITAAPFIRSPIAIDPCVALELPPPSPSPRKRKRKRKSEVGTRAAFWLGARQDLAFWPGKDLERHGSARKENSDLSVAF